MQKFKRPERQSLQFGLCLVLAGALLLPAAVAPRANAGSTDYWDFELSQPQGVLINQPLAFNYNPTLASNFASGAQPGGFQPLQVDALFSWTGATNSTWATSTNWSPAGPPGAADTAEFNTAFSNQPDVATSTSVGELLMTTGVAQNVTLSTGNNRVLTINGVAGTGIQIDNTVGANTLTISVALTLGAAQAWTNNSGNLLTISGGVALSGDNLTVNGTGNTLISGIAGAGSGSTLTKADSGTLTLTGTAAIGGGITVNGGTLLMNTTSTLNQPLIVNNAGTTLGGTGSIGGVVTINAGANIAPGNGGNTTGTLTMVGPLTLAANSNFRVDINGVAAFDQLVVTTSTVTITNSNLVVTVGTTLSVGQTFLILNKTNGGAIAGTFAGIPQGGTVTGSDGTVFQVSYTGGTGGNDIVLTVVQAAVPEPSTWMGGTLAIAGLAFMQRRRLRKLIARHCPVGS
ncbi:MAG: hypothetical protein WA849_02765 [Candidatus Udaeobacter sp.]